LNLQTFNLPGTEAASHGTYEVLLQSFAPVFTSPGFVTFRLLMTAWVLSTRHRYVTDLIGSSDSVGHGHFSDDHRFFSQAAWKIDNLWRLLAKLIIDHLIGKDAVIVLSGDDTLCRKRGLGIFGTGMHHDALSSSKSQKICHWGHDRVDLCIVIAHPWFAPSKVFSLPICMRLYRNRQGSKTPHKTRPELLAEMITQVAAWFPDRKFVLVADSLYSGKSVLSKLPGNFDLIGPVHPQEALYHPAPEETGTRRGPRRKKGERLPDAKSWEEDSSHWSTHHFDQYGFHGSLQTKTNTRLYYKAGNDRLLRLVLSCDTVGDRPTRIFYSTNVDLKAREILSLFSLR
jgi:hypothetical protein